MGLLDEKYEMMKRGMKNISNVVDGNFNYYLDKFGGLSKTKKAEAERRYEICSSCPFNSKNAPKHGFYETERTDEHCSVCLCPIEKKVMAFDEQCGLSYVTNLVDQNGNKILTNWKPKWFEYNGE